MWRIHRLIISYVGVVVTVVILSSLIARQIQESAYSAFGFRTPLLGSLLAFIDYFVYGGPITGRLSDFSIFFILIAPILAWRSNTLVHAISVRNWATTLVLIIEIIAIWLLHGFILYVQVIA